MGVILDSSILIAAERNRFDLVGFLSAHANDAILITAITASELLHGCERAKDSSVRERRTKFVEALLQDYLVLPFTLTEARAHSALWAELERKGTSIGERDLLIAATATTAGHSLATLNKDEFSRIVVSFLSRSKPSLDNNLRRKELLDFLHHLHKAVHFGFRVVEVKARARSGFNAEFVHQRLRAMMPAAQCHTGLIRQCHDVVRMNVLEQKAHETCTTR